MFAKQDGEEIMSHKFFEGVPFDEVLDGRIESPWVPELKSQRDTAFFEHYPDSEESARKIPSDMNSQYFVDF